MQQQNYKFAKINCCEIFSAIESVGDYNQLKRIKEDIKVDFKKVKYPKSFLKDFVPKFYQKSELQCLSFINQHKVVENETIEKEDLVHKENDTACLSTGHNVDLSTSIMDDSKHLNENEILKDDQKISFENYKLQEHDLRHDVADLNSKSSAKEQIKKRENEKMFNSSIPNISKTESIENANFQDKIESTEKMNGDNQKIQVMSKTTSEVNNKDNAGTNKNELPITANNKTPENELIGTQNEFRNSNTLSDSAAPKSKNEYAITTSSVPIASFQQNFNRIINEVDSNYKDSEPYLNLAKQSDYKENQNLSNHDISISNTIEEEMQPYHKSSSSSFNSIGSKNMRKASKTSAATVTENTKRILLFNFMMS